VVTPSYNQGRFLEQCIRSVLEQDYPDLEYLILDGGSTDGSVDVIRRYGRRLAFWVSERDGGQGAAINRGFRLATGDVVAWVNADDFYLPGALARVADAYRADPTASFFFGDGWRVDEAGQKVGNFFPGGRVRFHEPALVFGLNYVLQPAAFINRGHLAAVGYLDPALKYGMDSDLWIRLARRAAPVAVPNALAASREYAATKTATGAFERAEELRRIAERHSGLGMTPGALCYFLDTLNRLAERRPDVFPPHFLSAIQIFWLTVTRLLGRHGARADGFPACGDEGPAGLDGAVTVREADWAAREELIDRLSERLTAAQQQLEALRHRSLARRLWKFPRRVLRFFTRARAG
jgi:glycosyltransferase involved in cell wall biosynthesis